MLLGEHAVLHGHTALVCAVDRRIEVLLKERADSKIRIVSSLGRCITTVGRPAFPKSFRFIAAAIGLFRHKITTGFSLEIRSGFSHTVGLGSSAAVTVATIAALSAWLSGRSDPKKILLESVRVIRETQGLGSGADVAASVLGGIVAYRADPISARKLRSVCPITVVYSGSKKPTVEVVRLVEKARQAHPELFMRVYALMDLSARKAIRAIGRKDWAGFGALLNINQGLMDVIGVNNAALSDIVHALRKHPGIRGAKISGSGLGDCVIGIGSSAAAVGPYRSIPAQMSKEGFRVEKLS